MKYNFNTYNNTQCRTCAWLYTGAGRTACDIAADNYTMCDNYNHERNCCKCREKASDGAECPYYKKITKRMNRCMK